MATDNDTKDDAEAGKDASGADQEASKKTAAKKKAAKKKAAAEKKKADEKKDDSDRAQGTRPEDLEAAQRKQEFQEKAAESKEAKAKTALKGGDKRLFEEPLSGDDKAKAKKKAAKAKKKKVSKPEYVPPPVEVLQRRTFMRIFGWSGLAAFFAFLGGLAARFFWPRALFEPPTAFVAGFPSEFAVGEVNRNFQNAYRVWIIREATGMYALIAKCTHLGCTPVWIEAKNKFKCPCHGSGFTKEGVNFEGPAPRPLERARITQLPDGRIYVDKSKTFRKERGEWEKSGARLAV